MDSSVFASKKLVKSEVFAFVYPTIDERLNFMRSGPDDIRTLSPYRYLEYFIHRKRQVFTE